MNVDVIMSQPVHPFCPNIFPPCSDSTMTEFGANNMNIVFAVKKSAVKISICTP
jgi:hypothetical protein